MIGFRVAYDLLTLDRAEEYLNFLCELDAQAKFMHYAEGERKMTLHGIRSRLKKMDAQGNVFVVLALGLDGEIIGYFSVNGGNSQATRHSATVAVGVLKNYHRQGIARDLLKHAEAFALARCVDRFECTVAVPNVAAYRFYVASDFIYCGELHARFFSVGTGLVHDEVVYEKILR